MLAVSVTASTPLAAEPDPSSQTVAAYLAAWLGHVRGRVRAATYEGYEALLRLHALPHLGHLSIGEVTPLQVQGLYALLLAPSDEGAALSGGTVLNLHLVLTQAFAQAQRWQLIPANPLAGAQPPRPKRQPRIVVNTELLERLLKTVAGTWLELPAAIAAATGMRRGEILALRWQDLDADYSALRVQRSLQPTKAGLVFEQPKTPRSRRTVVLPEFLRPYLERQRNDQAARRELTPDWAEHDLVVDSGEGRPVNPDTLSAGWARHMRKHKLPQVRFHDLRHAHATLMLTQGVHPKVVSERLGHASIGITLDTYSHVLPTLQKEAAEAFDQLFAR